MPSTFEIQLCWQDSSFYVVADAMPLVADRTFHVTDGSSFDKRVLYWETGYYDALTAGALIPPAGCANPLAWPEYPNLSEYMYIPEDNVASVHKVSDLVTPNIATADMQVFFEVFVHGRIKPISCYRNVPRPWYFKLFSNVGVPHKQTTLLTTSNLLAQLPPNPLTLGPVPTFSSEGFTYGDEVFDGEFRITLRDVRAIVPRFNNT